MNSRIILTRIKSIRQTVQISSAQKLVAASHIGKARKMLRDSLPYHERIRCAIAEVLALCPEVSSKFLDTGDTPVSKHGVLVISANRGLAGGYNSNMNRFALQKLSEHPTVHLTVLGRVGQLYLSKAGYDVDTSFEHAVDPPTIFAATELAKIVMRMFEKGDIDCFSVIYTHYTSTVRLTPTISRLLPLNPEIFSTDTMRDLVSFEPSPDAVLRTLIPKYLAGYIYGCLVHSWASELASRVAAMDSAIRNGNEMLEALSLAYNRMRQASITQEITEIVAGVASLAEAE